MINIQIQVPACPRAHQPVRVGFPLARGLVYDAGLLRLLGPNSSYIASLQISVSNRWFDGSLKWLLLEFVVAEKAKEPSLYRLVYDSVALERLSSFQTREDSNSLIVSNQIVKVSAEKHSFSLVLGLSDCDSLNQNLIRTIKPYIRFMENEVSAFECTTARLIETSGNARHSIEMIGKVSSSASNRSTGLNIVLRVDIYDGSDQIHIMCVLHNEKAARHAGGFWDLGDQGSALIREFGLVVSKQEHSCLKVHLGNKDVREVSENQKFCLHQESSGGHTWQNSVHVNANNVIEPQYSGYQFLIDGSLVTSGSRANPVVELEDEVSSLCLGIDKFWQNFPTSIASLSEAIQIGLLPDNSAFGHELQGGEKKSSRISLSVSKDRALGCESTCMSYCPMLATVSAEYLQTTNAIHAFSSKRLANPIDLLLIHPVDGENTYVSKREEFDEFGWRNFGEIPADHESLYELESGRKRLVSHYNNQYDGVYGLLLQFLYSADQEWFLLMDELALHVTDIDIYDTQYDRLEFNGGLFWHTDHYEDAATSTHRTYSKLHQGAAGGGPGCEHCYTTGLLHHYFLTGSEASKRAVILLSDWMVNASEGHSGLLGSLDSVRKHEWTDACSLLRGDNTISYRFPLSRATGNYINALLDRYELTGETDWLLRVESVIAHTLHPGDDVTKRNLDNIEVNWSYLVVLQSIHRYLIVKNDTDSIDMQYEYARSSFLHYARWVAENETFYLDRAEQLEYPNTTWAAQEIRKACILLGASQLSPREKEHFDHKASEYLVYLCNMLSDSETTYMARIQIILLQNYVLPSAFYQEALSKIATGEERLWNTPGSITYVGILTRTISKLLSGIRNFSPKGELDWIKARLNSRSHS